MDRPVREALLKNDSIGNQLNLKFASGTNSPTLKIKLEVDVNPPAGSGFAHTYIDFPLDFEVCHQDLRSCSRALTPSSGVLQAARKSAINSANSPCTWIRTYWCATAVPIRPRKSRSRQKNWRSLSYSPAAPDAP